MLLFIFKFLCTFLRIHSFQYISCYCLSVMAVLIRSMNRFQYISCYCLSAGTIHQGLTFSGFQYISCYCLSFLLHALFLILQNFNTSHVTVYLCHICQYIHCCLYFNTSHVTVYLQDLL